MGGGAFGYILSFGGCALLTVFVIAVAFLLVRIGRRKERSGLEPVARVRDMSSPLREDGTEGKHDGEEPSLPVQTLQSELDLDEKNER